MNTKFFLVIGNGGFDGSTFLVDMAGMVKVHATPSETIYYARPVGRKAKQLKLARMGVLQALCGVTGANFELAPLAEDDCCGMGFDGASRLGRVSEVVTIF